MSENETKMYWWGHFDRKPTGWQITIRIVPGLYFGITKVT